MPRNYNKNVEKKRKDVPFYSQTGVGAERARYNAVAAQNDYKSITRPGLKPKASKFDVALSKAAYKGSLTSSRKETKAQIERNRTTMRKQTASKKK